MFARRLTFMILATVVSSSAWAKAADTNYILRLKSNGDAAKTFELSSCLNADVSSCQVIGEDLTVADLSQITQRLRTQRNFRVAGLGGSVVLGALGLITTGAVTFVVSGAAQPIANGALASAGELLWAGILAPVFTYSAIAGAEASGAAGIALASSGPLLWSAAGHYALGGKFDAINPTAYHRAMNAVLEAQKESADQIIDGKSLTKLFKAISAQQAYKEEVAKSAYDSVDVFSIMESR